MPMSCFHSPCEIIVCIARLKKSATLVTSGDYLEVRSVSYYLTYLAFSRTDWKEESRNSMQISSRSKSCEK